MPTTAAVLTGLTYKSTDLQDFPRIFLQLVEGGPDDTPETRGENSTTPYRRGQTYGPRRADRLPIMLKGWVAGDGVDEDAQRADTAAARQELKALFDVEGGEGVLAATTEDGTDWTINAYPEVIVWQAGDEGIPTHRGVSVRLIACDPPEWEAGGS